MTSLISVGAIPDSSQMRATPLRTPMDESSGVEGTLAVKVAPLSSLSSRKSVKVPPTSTPSRYVIADSSLLLCSDGPVAWQAVISRSSCFLASPSGLYVSCMLLVSQSRCGA
jgi:hypothetical protein